MYFTKLSLFITGFVTVFFGVWIDQSVPYFPIEISRTATGPYSRVLFPLGAFTSLIVAYFEVKTKHYLIVFAGFLLLALVNDKQSWSIHMLGVVLMFGGIASKIYHDNTKYMTFGLILCIYMGRIVLKILTLTHYGYRIFEKAKDIMYTGNADTPAQLLIFKLCGILQWVVLYGMLELYTQ